MKTARMEQIRMVELFGSPEFQHLRLKTLKEDHFEEWKDEEKAVYYQVARMLIEEELHDFDRESDWEGFRALLRNRYETFLAQKQVETRPDHKVNVLVQLGEIAEHEEGEGEGVKYIEAAAQALAEVAPADQEAIGSLLAKAMGDQPKGLALNFLKTVGVWEDDNMMILAFETLEAMAEGGMVDHIEFRATADAVVNYLMESRRGEYALRMVNRLVQLVKEEQAKPEIRAHFWKMAYEAACTFDEPFTKMLMALLLGDYMKQSKDWQSLKEYVEVVEGVADFYGQRATYGNNYDQIAEAVEEMKTALKESLN